MEQEISPEALKSEFLKECRIAALSQGYAHEVKEGFLLFNTLDAKRLEFETFEEYKFRLRVHRRVIKRTKQGIR